MKQFVVICLALALLPVALCATTIPSECVGLPASSWVDVQQNLFSLSGVGTWVSVVYDSAASDRLAAKMPASYAQRAVQYTIPATLTGLRHCYAAIKCDATTNLGNAFTLGIWDNSTNTAIIQKTVRLQDGAGSGLYRDYDLGIQRLTTSMYLWVAGPGSVQATPAVYVDRFFFVDMTSTASLTRLSDTAGIADGASVYIALPKVVTTPPCAFADASAYIEEPDRSSGLLCVFDSGITLPSVWDNITLGGTMATDAAGERYISVSSILTSDAGSAIGALGASDRSISRGKPDMSGLLVRTWGRVSFVDPGGAFFYVDDGSAVTDASELSSGVRVTPVTTVPTVGDFVTVTGIASKTLASDGDPADAVPVVRTANGEDLTPSMPIVQQNGFLLYGLGTWVSVVDDPLASDGRAAKMPANTTERAVRYRIPATVADAGPVHCYARIRCDATASSGNAFSLGIHDDNADADIASQTVRLQDGAGDGNYRLYDLGIHSLTTSMYVWVAPPGSAQSTPAVYVDYFSFDRTPVITSNGGGYSIVIGDNAAAEDNSAATELQQTLQAVTGATLPMRTESETPSTAPQILVGQSNRAKNLLPGLDWSALGTDGIVIKNVGSDLILAGGEPRGTLYAVYDFLENYVGCRWWTSTESYVPSTPSLSIPVIDKVYTPTFSYRQAYYLDAISNPSFAAKLKDNGNYAPMRLFSDTLPLTTYFGPHPEWYSLIDGVRTGVNAQLCLTNTAMQQQYITNVLAWIAAHPGVTTVTLAQNDNGNYCQCENCQAVARAEGSQMGPLIRFVNAVADAVRAQYPNITIQTLAYQWSQNPPALTRPASNVLIEYCDNGGNFCLPLTDPSNTYSSAALAGWHAITSNLWVWDYTANFANYIIPHPNLGVFGSNISFFATNGVHGVFEQGDYQSPCGDFCRLKCWVLDHLLWDPSLSESDLINEFCNGYYGAAGPHIVSYLNAIDSAAANCGYFVGCANTNYNFLTLSVMNQAQQYLSSAAAAVADDPVLSARVQRDSLSLQHAWALLYPELKQQQVIYNLPWNGPTDQVSTANSFIATAENHRAGYVREGASFSSYEPTLRSKCRRVATVPTECQGLSDWIDVPNNMFYLPPNNGSSIVTDSFASTGYAAKITGDSTNWAVQYYPGSWVTGAGKWRCYARVRCECNGTSGDAFSLGIYDSGTQRSIYGHTFKLDDGANDGLYHTYDLGIHTLTGSMFFWFAPVNNPTLVPSIYVDRIFMIRAN